MTPSFEVWPWEDPRKKGTMNKIDRDEAIDANTLGQKRRMMPTMTEDIQHTCIVHIAEDGGTDMRHHCAACEDIRR